MTSNFPVSTSVPKKSVISTTVSNAVTNVTGVDAGQMDDNDTQQTTSTQNAEVRVVHNGLLNQNSATQLISISGSMLQILNLVSNPVPSSFVVCSSQGKQSVVTHVNSGNSNSGISVSPDNGASLNSDNLLKEDLVIGVKESLNVERGAPCLLATMDGGKSQDGPLDLSTCTSLQQPVRTKDSRKVTAPALGVKLTSFGCVLLTDTK